MNVRVLLVVYMVMYENTLIYFSLKITLFYDIQSNLPILTDEFVKKGSCECFYAENIFWEKFPLWCCWEFTLVWQHE